MKKSYSLIGFILIALSSLHAQWTELGRGTHALNANSYIYSVVTDAQGNIYAAGDFTDGSGNYNVAKWDGTNWAQLGTGNNALNANGTIQSMAIDASGNIYVGGYFYDVPSNTWFVAKWNGTTWSMLGSLGAGSYIFSVHADAQNNLYAAGQFMDANNKYYVSKWDGTSWSTLGAGNHAFNANGHINSLTTDAQGNVYAGGYFVNGSGKCYVAKWNGTDWSELAGSQPLNAQTGSEYIYSVITDASGNVYAAGAFRNAAGDQYVAKWNGSNWAELGSGANALHANDFINTLTTDAAGNIYAAGRFTDSTGSPYVAKWNGTTWSELSAGTDSLHANDYIYTLIPSRDGGLLAAGFFTDSAGHQYVAKFASTNTSVQNISSSLSTISVSPNPSNGHITLNITDENLMGAAITITDMIGEEIQTLKINSFHQQMNIAEYPKGMYLVTISNGTMKTTRKIVLE